jgi:hypothetical protein
MFLCFACATAREDVTNTQQDSRRFITHHIQRISFGIAMEDAKQINRRITCLKQRAYRTYRRS